MAHHTYRRLRCELLENRRLLTSIVLSTSPLNAAAGSPRDLDIGATFSAAVAPESVTDQSFVVNRRQSGQLLSAQGDITSLVTAQANLTLDPSSNFYPGESVQVTATAALKDHLSASIAAYVWDFQAATTGGSGAYATNGQDLAGESVGWHVALGDVDGDGDLDALATSLQKELTDPVPNSNLWLNQGGQQGGIAGQFEIGQEIESNRHHDIALGDLDGDGDLDAFFANSTGTPNTIWLNQGGLQSGTQGVFADSGQRLGNSLSRGVALGDLDGDGDLDAFITNRNDQPNRVWLNQGGLQQGTAGEFEDSGQLLGNSTSYDVALGDIDNDGDLDAFVANLNVEVDQANRVWINDGSGSFSDSNQLLGSSQTRAVSLGDLDNDGDLDAVVANSLDKRVWWNQGGAQGGTLGQFVDSGQILGITDYSSHDIALGDLDGDGDLDLFAANLYGRANTVWINQGGSQGGAVGQFADSGHRLGHNSSFGVALGDLDNDGDLDAFVVNRGDGQSDVVWINQDLSADFDSDSDVDGVDFLTWQRGFGQTSGAGLEQGDADSNGTVDAADLAAWRQQRGQQTASLLSAINQPVPLSGLKVTEQTSSDPKPPSMNALFSIAVPRNAYETMSVAANRSLVANTFAPTPVDPTPLDHVDRALQELFPDAEAKHNRLITSFFRGDKRSSGTLLNARDLPRDVGMDLLPVEFDLENKRR